MIVWTIKCPCGECDREARVAPDAESLARFGKEKTKAYLKREALVEAKAHCPGALDKTEDDIEIEESEE